MEPHLFRSQQDITSGLINALNSAPLAPDLEQFQVSIVVYEVQKQ